MDFLDVYGAYVEKADKQANRALGGRLRRGELFLASHLHAEQSNEPFIKTGTALDVKKWL